VQYLQFFLNFSPETKQPFTFLKSFFSSKAFQIHVIYLKKALFTNKVLLREFFGVGAFFPRFFCTVLPAISLFLVKVLVVRTRVPLFCVFSGMSLQW
jgi:hypothetical protein